MRLQRAMLVLIAGGVLLAIPPSAQAQFGQGAQAEALIGDFLLLTSEDPITDAQHSALVTDAEGTIAGAESLSDLTSAIGQLELSSQLMSGATLTISCRGEASFRQVIVMNQQAVWLGDAHPTQVTIRFDSDAPEQVRWGAFGSGVGSPSEESSRQFLKKARPSRKVAIRYTDGGDTQHTHVFSLMGLTEGLQRLPCQ